VIDAIEKRDRLVDALRYVIDKYCDSWTSAAVAPVVVGTPVAAEPNSPEATPVDPTCVALSVMVIPESVAEPGCRVIVHLGGTSGSPHVHRVCVEDRQRAERGKPGGNETGLELDLVKSTHSCYDFVALVLNHPTVKAELLAAYPDRSDNFNLDMLPAVAQARAVAIEELIESSKHVDKKNRSM